MATQKHSKAELIAIYRLEFYKKQKNWKLSTDTRKEKELRKSCPTAPVNNNNILNETYSIDTNTDNNANVLNDAFLQDESDKDIPSSPSAQTSLHTQWLAPINVCEECQHSDQTPFKPQNPWADYVNNVDDGWTGQDMKCSGDGNEFEGFDGCAEGMVWTNSGITPGWTGDVPTCYQPVPECPEQMVWAADTVLYHQLDQQDHMIPWPNDQMWVPSIWGEDELLVASLESVEEFMIGAHSAPHSSEIELCGATETEGDNMSEGSLSRLSAAELSAAVRRHTGSLRKLLREAGKRKYRSTLSLDLCAPDHFGLAPRDFFSTDYSYEAFPTRDIPSTPLSPMYLGKDAFTPLSSTNQCKDVAPNQCKDTFTPVPSKLLKETCTPLSPRIQCNAFVAANQCTTFAPPSPANLYRHGFLAGSYRNKVQPGLVGRGRGRLQGSERLA